MRTSSVAIRSSSRALFSLREVTTLTEVPEARIRKDIETGLLEGYVKRRNETRLYFDSSSLFVVAAVYSNARMSAEYRKSALIRLKRFDISRKGIDLEAISRSKENRVYVDKYIYIDMADVYDTLSPRLDLYMRGLDRIEQRADVLGGEAVFKGTRLPVTHVGRMLDRGEELENILEDYPYLNEDDVRFARLYYRAHPPVGRPRMSGETPNGADAAPG